MTMNEDLCRRFLDIVESLATDPRTARGAFYRWKGRALRHGAWGARPLHADLADRAMRQSTPAELTASVLEEHVVKAENAPNPLGAPSVVVMDDAPRPGTAPPALGRTRPPIEGRPMPMEARLHAAALPETEPFPGAGGRRAPARGPLLSRPRTAGDRPDGVRGMTTYRQARRLPPLTPELRSKAAPCQLGADPRGNSGVPPRTPPKIFDGIFEPTPAPRGAPRTCISKATGWVPRRRRAPRGGGQGGPRAPRRRAVRGRPRRRRRPRGRSKGERAESRRGRAGRRVLIGCFVCFVWELISSTCTRHRHV